MRTIIHQRFFMLQLALAFAMLAMAVTQAANAAAASPTLTVIHCARLIDTDAGKLLGATSVVIEGERIREVVTGTVDRENARVIDMPADHTCLPGLIDSHTHMNGVPSKDRYGAKFRLNPADYAVYSTLDARDWLWQGFTSVRSLGDSNGVTIALRNAINAGAVPGPRIFTSGKAIGSTGGHGDSTTGYRQDLQGDQGPKDGIVDSPADAWKAVRQHYKDGVDLLKIMASGGVLDESSSSENPQMTDEELRAVVAAAHDYGFTVAAHAHGAEAIRRAVIAGVDSIEHGTFLDDQGMKLMKQSGTWLVPTILAGQFVMKMATGTNSLPPQVARKAMEVGPKMIDTTRKAYQAGVRIAFGTDTHGDNAQEFVNMVEAGIPPMYAIQSATVNAAALLKRSKDLGSITAGKYADVVVVSGNPLEDIALMKKVEFVMKAGTVYRQGGHATEAML